MLRRPKTAAAPLWAAGRRSTRLARPRAAEPMEQASRSRTPSWVSRLDLGLDAAPDAQLQRGERRIGLELLAIADVKAALMHLLDAPRSGGHHHDAGAQRHRFLDIMGDEQHCLGVATPDAAHLVLQDPPGLRVKRAEGFIHQQ